MKLSERLREKAKQCDTGMRGSGEISHDETTEWKAADLLDECERVIERYRRETPLGNQPHMIAHKADELLAKLRTQENADE